MWFVVCAVGFVIFILCRKRKADIGLEVAEEVDHAIRRIQKAAREAEEQLRDAFLDFRNPSAAVQEFQKARGEIEGVPRANPNWGWSEDDLGLLRKRSVADETARRYRPWAFASIVGIVALTVGSAVASVILTNSEPPALATPANTASLAGGSPPPALPAPVNWSPTPAPMPVNLPPPPTSAGLPPLPPSAPYVPADLSGSPPVASAQGNINNMVSPAQGGTSVQTASGQGGQTPSNPGPSTAPTTAATSLAPQVDAITPPSALQSPAADVSNVPNDTTQNTQNSKTCVNGVTASNPNADSLGGKP